jgi:hypothetical protein
MKTASLALNHTERNPLPRLSWTYLPHLLVSLVLLLLLAVASYTAPIGEPAHVENHMGQHQ